jgi:signal transduction histidine kinase
VVAREEERRRLRGDLHDSVGPELAGLTMGLEAAENMLAADPAGAASALAVLRERASDAVGTVRAVVDGLRPPALDELGLAAAIRQRAGALVSGAGPRLDVTVSGDVAALPAATEVAAYHIALEAIANAVRHAAATTVSVKLLAANHEMRIIVRDDGTGLPEHVREGAVGLISMRERAEELGGSMTVETSDGGTAVTAALPLPRRTT